MEEILNEAIALLIQIDARYKLSPMVQVKIAQIVEKYKEL